MASAVPATGMLSAPAKRATPAQRAGPFEKQTEASRYAAISNRKMPIS